MVRRRRARDLRGDARRDAAAKPNHDSASTSLRVRPQGRGFAAEGREFYVWDEDEEEVTRAARELSRGNYAVSPPRRMLIVLSGAPRRASLSLSNPESLDN